MPILSRFKLYVRSVKLASYTFVQIHLPVSFVVRFGLLLLARSLCIYQSNRLEKSLSTLRFKKALSLMQDLLMLSDEVRILLAFFMSRLLLK